MSIYTVSYNHQKGTNTTKQSSKYPILKRLLYTPRKVLHNELKVLLIRDIYKLSILKFVYKQQNYLLPEIFNDYFSQTTRYKKTIRCITHKTDIK